MKTWYVVFHPASLKSPLGIFGHVEIVGFDGETTWVFLNPSRKGAVMEIAYKHDTVETWLAVTFSKGVVLRYEGEIEHLTPIWPILSCVSICAHMVGMRAFTPRGFKRKLLKNGAKVIFDGTKGKQGIESSPEAGTAGC